VALIQVQTGRDIAAPQDHVFACVADFKQHRPKWLPPNYSDLVVEEGGVGAGTKVRYRLKVGPRERTYHMQIGEPAPGSVLVENDTQSSMAITWTVTPRGAGSHVQVQGQWQGAAGVGGFFERMFAPRGLRRLFDDDLTRLATYATGSPSSPA
jgi:uncharacterized protein YndB with AHSA1/START domain